MGNTQDDLIARLMAGEFGPWAGQGFVPGGITILRPDTWQWETITALAGSADLTMSELSDPVDPGMLEEDEDFVLGLPVEIGLPALVTTVGGGGSLAPRLLTVVPAGQYTYLDFVRTDLGEVRLTEGMSNGSTGPLSPIRIGNLQEVDHDGNKWLPVVRMQNIEKPAGGGGGSW